MKKIILIIILLMFYLSNKTYTYELSNQDKILVNKLVYSINKKIENKSIYEKNRYKDLLYKIVSQKSNNQQIKNIITETLKKTYLYDYKKEFTNHYKKNNIDFSHIQKKWLEWHNTERKKSSLTQYSYDDRLNNTAYQWSIQQSILGKMSHERNVGDGFYNYNVIEKWFQDRLVKCVADGGVTSSESIGKFGYYCSNSDCTKKLEDSLKIIFNIYLNEKDLPRSQNAHYRAITHRNLKKIGLGLYINKTSEKDYYEYYVTTHYCTKFIDN